MLDKSARPRILLGLAPALLLAGCISFGPKPPHTMLTLAATAQAPVGAARTTDDAHAVAVAIPSVPPTLATQRLLVHQGAQGVAYLTDATWVAQPALLFRNLLAETITATTGRFVPDQRQTGAQPDTRLSGQLTDFGLEGGGGAVVVSFEGVINKSGQERMQTRRFTARVPVASEDPVAVGAALNQAANQVAGEVAAWLG